MYKKKNEEESIHVQLFIKRIKEVLQEYWVTTRRYGQTTKTFPPLSRKRSNSICQLQMLSPTIAKPDVPTKQKKLNQPVGQFSFYIVSRQELLLAYRQAGTLDKGNFESKIQALPSKFFFTIHGYSYLHGSNQQYHISASTYHSSLFQRYLVQLPQ